MLARVLPAALNGIEAFPVEVEVNSGWGDTTVVVIETPSPGTPLALRNVLARARQASGAVLDFVRTLFAE